MLAEEFGYRVLPGAAVDTLGVGDPPGPGAEAGYGLREPPGQNSVWSTSVKMPIGSFHPPPAQSPLTLTATRRLPSRVP
ncbi:hypothetical protein J2S55_008779 [Streptosporangium brasiliense]|uniref:Uncharacterized protein n=1 Tax=Streptosporangium brasiliense TaxID=47480 RepID=A0ABT9RKA1_9ACTN|nr:hypothetical protein [Streptosporangium brasiliense]